MKLAVVSDGVVVGLIPGNDPSSHPTLPCVVCPDNTQIGWIYDGTTFAAIVPQLVDRFHGLAAMMLTPSKVNAGKTVYDDALAAATSAGGLTLIALQSATQFERHGSAIIAQLAAVLTLTDADLDALFILAGSIQA